MALDPQAEAVRQITAGTPPLWELSLPDGRAAAEGFAALQGEPEAVAEVRELSVPGPGGVLPVRVYRPAGASPDDRPPLVVYFHGGGWTIGSVELLDRPCRAIANASRAVVASVEYRLAPEHKFPAAADDAYAATVWLGEHAGEIGAAPGRLVVAGDSAGGNLAAVTALQMRDRGGPGLAGQALLFAVTAPPSHGFASYSEAAEGYLLTRADMEWFWANYTRGPDDDRDPLAAPLLAADLSGLPPALVMVAGYDVLRDEGLAYAGRLEEAGGQVTVRRFDGQMHDFLWTLAAVDDGRRAVTDIADFVRTVTA